MGYILGIDTSNYKTSIAVIDHKKHIICDLRRFLTVKQGERGLRQSDALFQHIQNLPELMEEMRRMFDGRIDAVACSFRPRPEAGSYMPVFLAGSGFAKAAAAAITTSYSVARLKRVGFAIFLRKLFNIIPPPPHGLYVFRILRVLLDFPPQIPDVDHHIVVGGVKIRFIPDALIDILRGKDLSPVL